MSKKLTPLNKKEYLVYEDTDAHVRFFIKPYTAALEYHAYRALDMYQDNSAPNANKILGTNILVENFVAEFETMNGEKLPEGVKKATDFFMTVKNNIVDFIHEEINPFNLEKKSESEQTGENGLLPEK